MKSVLSLCSSCEASNLVELDAEICIHFRGLVGLDVEPIWAYSKLRVCLYCGLIQPDLSTKELHGVRAGARKIKAISEATVSWRKPTKRSQYRTHTESL